MPPLSERDEHSIVTAVAALDALDRIEAAVPAERRERAHVEAVREWVRRTESRAALAEVLHQVTAAQSAIREELAHWRPMMQALAASHLEEAQRAAQRAAGTAGAVALIRTPAGYIMALALAGAIGALVERATGISVPVLGPPRVEAHP
jgi:hypothetical protein